MQEKLPRQCAAHSRHSTNFIPAPAHPPGEESMHVSGTGMVRAGGNPFSPPPPGGSRPPICCPRCIPIRRISQPGGSGYRRLNDKVPPLPARPPRTRRDALWFQRARSAPALEELGARCAQPARGAARRRREPQGLQAADSARVHFPPPPGSPRPALLLPGFSSTRGTLPPARVRRPPAPPGSTRLLSAPVPPPAPFPVERRLSPAAFASKGARRHSQTLGRSHKYPPLSRGKGGPRPKKVSVPPAFIPHRWAGTPGCPFRRYGQCRAGDRVRAVQPGLWHNWRWDPSQVV